MEYSSNKMIEKTLGPLYKVRESNHENMPPYRTMIMFWRFSWVTMEFWNEIAWILHDIDRPKQYCEKTIFTKSESVGLELSGKLKDYRIVVV